MGNNKKEASSLRAKIGKSIGGLVVFAIIVTIIAKFATWLKEESD